jgi:hypothetical protein
LANPPLTVVQGARLADGLAGTEPNGGGSELASIQAMLSTGCRNPGPHPMRSIMAVRVRESAAIRAAAASGH